MAYVVKDKELNRYTYFNRFVQGMNIIYDHEPIGSIDEATEFEDEDEFKYIMTQLENQGEDVSRFILCDIDNEKQLIKDEQDKEALSAMANGWDNTSEEGKTEYLKEVLTILDEENINVKDKYFIADNIYLSIFLCGRKLK